MDFRPLNDTERRTLVNALRGNAESDRAILMDRRDTSFLGELMKLPTRRSSAPSVRSLVITEGGRLQGESRLSSIDRFALTWVGPTRGVHGARNDQIDEKRDSPRK